MILASPGMASLALARYGALWFGEARRAGLGPGPLWRVPVLRDWARSGTAGHGGARFAPARCGVACRGSFKFRNLLGGPRPGLVRSGIVRRALVRIYE